MNGNEKKYSNVIVKGFYLFIILDDDLRCIWEHESIFFFQTDVFIKNEIKNTA